MITLPGFDSLRTTADYDAFLKASYLGAKPRVQELCIPAVRALAVNGNEPPGTKQYQDAIGVLYGIAYSLKMGLKFGSLTGPADYFDYRVGALETAWWSVGEQFDISNPETLRWQAFLIVPAFVTAQLVDAARALAKAKHPEARYETADLVTIDEGHVVQMLHVGPYDREQPTIAALHAYAAEHGLAVSGKHHEIYISDPGRTRPEKLRTVIRFPIKPA